MKAFKRLSLLYYIFAGLILITCLILFYLLLGDADDWSTTEKVISGVEAVVFLVIGTLGALFLVTIAFLLPLLQQYSDNHVELYRQLKAIKNHLTGEKKEPNKNVKHVDKTVEKDKS